jgi:hypothetical protein
VRSCPADSDPVTLDPNEPHAARLNQVAQQVAIFRSGDIAVDRLARAAPGPLGWTQEPHPVDTAVPGELAARLFPDEHDAKRFLAECEAWAGELVMNPSRTDRESGSGAC